MLPVGCSLWDAPSRDVPSGDTLRAQEGLGAAQCCYSKPLFWPGKISVAAALSLGMGCRQVGVSHNHQVLKARGGLLGVPLPLLAGELLLGDVGAAVPLPTGRHGGIRARLLKGPWFALFHPGSSKEDEVYLVLQE